MDEYAGRVLAERYRLPLWPSDADSGDGAGDDDFAECPAFDTYSGQEVLVRQVPLPEVVEAEFVDGGRFGEGEGSGAGYGGAGARRTTGVADRSPRDPAVRRAWEAATAAAGLPDHPLLEQVFDVFAQDGSLWIVGERVAARPLAALLAAQPLSPHRAAEIAADVLTALRALQAHGWIHRNITDRTVLICDDGRAILTGLALGAAQEALCGYEPVPQEAEAEAAEALEVAAPRAVVLTKDSARTSSSAATAYGRPTAGLAAERARQARLNVVGPVTERWAPEQAGPLDEEGRPAAPVGPATDLWAIGALLFRSVLGRPPYPEESAVELARLVCAQPPGSAEECGALRPVVESLLSQDPAERPDFEELRGRLRTLIRTAPEPDVGSRLVTMPALGRGTDPRRLPILRRRGELVRRGRLKKGRTQRVGPPQARPVDRPQAPSAPRPPKPLREPVPRPSRPARAPRQARGPRHLGRLLLGLILLLLVGAVAFAMLFMPKSGEGSESGRDGAAPTGTSGATGADPGASPAPSTGQDGDNGGGQDGSSAGTGQPQSTTPADLAEGFQVRNDPAGFQVAVREGWQRRAANERGQVRYLGGDYELVIVPGRDTTGRFGTDPMAYQQNKEAELAPYRSSNWSSSSGLRRIDVGQTAMAEGTFTWRDRSGREVYVRNLAMIHNGRYHLVLVIGPDDGRHEVDRLYEQATNAYRPG
ncbi:hypothetical protein FCH28_19580 [Streptomyces piniterrae]|uniref:Protein kinase domain-containing protein n=1 Tax=Streptomyces piniterrae TaxID=2571125 RepID=A0A4U0NDI3_9ACTN|nr:protein kinase [Streptomyces piniterrae]TJZ52046.1 hypothetical protein FCH28_19580 [Streptomyces piniterrae]